MIKLKDNQQTNEKKPKQIENKVKVDKISKKEKDYQNQQQKKKYDLILSKKLMADHHHHRLPSTNYTGVK